MLVDVVLLADVVLLVDEEDAPLSELDAVELLPDDVLSSPLQATIALAHDTAPMSKKNHAFRCFIKEPPGSMIKNNIIDSGRLGNYFF